MKSFLLAIALTVLLILGGIFYNNSLSEESQHLNYLTNNIMTSLETEDYSRAALQLSELNSQVEKFKKFYFVTDNHAEVDNIKLHISELTMYIQEESKTDALATANALKFLFMHLPENVLFRLGNIF